MKRVLFTLAFLAATAGAYAQDIAFFEKTYNVKLTGIKPKSEYPDPDQFYTAIAEELGIPELAYAALKENCGWKQQEGQLLYPMIKRGANSGRWGFMFCRVLLNEETKRPDTSTLETRMLEIDDAGEVYFHGSDTQMTETMLKDLLKARTIELQKITMLSSMQLYTQFALVRNMLEGDWDEKLFVQFSLYDGMNWQMMQSYEEKLRGDKTWGPFLKMKNSLHKRVYDDLEPLIRKKRKNEKLTAADLETLKVLNKLIFDKLIK